MTAILITSLILSGCAASKNDNDKKVDEKVSHKERDKSKSLSGLAFYILDFHLFKNYSIHELET